MEANDILFILEVLALKMGPKMAIKVYQKPTHTDCYLHFNSSHMKQGAIRSLLSRAKVTYQDGLKQGN
jgi:hypothetical protein